MREGGGQEHGVAMQIWKTMLEITKGGSFRTIFPWIHTYTYVHFFKLSFGLSDSVCSQLVRWIHLYSFDPLSFILDFEDDIPMDPYVHTRLFLQIIMCSL